MIRPALLTLLSAAAFTAVAATASVAAPAVAKWPPWISIESPVNPFDASARGAAFLIRAAVREGTPTLANVSGTAEGLVDGVRKSIRLHIDTTSQPGVFAVHKQWPANGSWVLRISLLTTTAIVSLDRGGNIAGVTVPTIAQSGMQIPRTVAAHEIDDMLTAAAKR